MALRGSAFGLLLTVASACAAGASEIMSDGLPDLLEAHASGVFLNADGDVLTARHAVLDCRRIFVIRGRSVSRAQIVTDSAPLDLAVLKTTLTPYLSATIIASPHRLEVSRVVFTEAYSRLLRAHDSVRVISNAIALPGGTSLRLLSAAQPGASGSPVLGSDGLLWGVVLARVAHRPGVSGGLLSRAGRVHVPGGATYVHAVPADKIQTFLAHNEVPFTSSDVPQLGRHQSPAVRAATLSVGVLCDGTDPVNP